MNWEWILVLIIIVVLFLWGPQKLPELARSIGLARREFERASRGMLEPSVIESSSDEKLIEIARSLGIETKGKTRDEIAKEILEKVKASTEKK